MERDVERGLRAPWVVILACGLVAAAVGMSYPYVDLWLNRMGASPTAIGWNAAMPPLAWLVLTPFLPAAVQRIALKPLALGLIVIAAAAACALVLVRDPDFWMGARFLFGGGLGLLFRLVEYWLGAVSPDGTRGRVIGVYATVFCGGAAGGTAALSMIGLDGWTPVLLMIGLLGAAAVMLLRSSLSRPRHADAPVTASRSVFTLVPLSLVAAFVYGAFEAAPLTLMPVYDVHIGLSETQASLAASWALLGALLFPLPIGVLADRWGKRRALAGCAVVASAICLGLPLIGPQPDLQAVFLVLLGGAAGSIYTVGLAMMADDVQGRTLVRANAAFGTVYACAAVAGPPALGCAMDVAPPHGFLIAATGLFAVLLLALSVVRPRQLAPVTPD